MILLVLAAASLAATAASDWRPYAVGGFGFGESAIYYNAGRLERRAAIVRVWTRHSFHYSGRNPSEHHTRYEIDCGRRAARVLSTIDYDFITYREQPRPRRRRESFAPIGRESNLAGLAERVCDGAAPAAAPAWIALPDPVPSAAAPLSYDPAVRRRGGKVHVWTRYVTIDERIRLQVSPGASEAEVRTDALIELDCAGRTQRTLDRLIVGPIYQPSHDPGADAPPAPIAAGSREAALAARLCHASLSSEALLR